MGKVLPMSVHLRQRGGLYVRYRLDRLRRHVVGSDAVREHVRYMRQGLAYMLAACAIRMAERPFKREIVIRYGGSKIAIPEKAITLAKGHPTEYLREQWRHLLGMVWGWPDGAPWCYPEGAQCLAPWASLSDVVNAETPRRI